MSVLLFGVSHRSAPVSVLEQLSTDESDQIKIIDEMMQSPLVTEAIVLSTCNRVEVYAVVDAFHGGLSAIGQVLAEQSGMSLGDLTKYAYVRYSEAAVEHLLLADHRGIEATGHREQVLDGGLAVADVGIFGEVRNRHAGVVGKYLADGRQAAVEGVDHGVDLDAVAGREHHGLGYQRRLHHPVDDLDLLGFVGAELLQNGDRRAAVRHTEEQDAHG